MFMLLETAIAFVVVMLLLSLMVKSLTSLVKNYVDYYSRNLEREFKKLLLNLSFVKHYQKVLDRLMGPGGSIRDFREIGEEMLELDSIKQILGLDEKVKDFEARVAELKTKLAVLKANVNYQFKVQSKNLSLVLGVTMCLALNINGFTIWETLYSDADLRARLSSDTYIGGVDSMMDNVLKDAEVQGDEVTLNALQEQRRQFQEDVLRVGGDVQFGMGKIWQKRPLGKDDKNSADGNAKNVTNWFAAFDFKFILFEFFGALLTGILISIGAPYWHDLLRTLVDLKSKTTKPKG